MRKDGSLGAYARHSQSSAHAVYAIFFLNGIASSLPYNVFVTAQDYFHQRLLDTAYEESFVNWFSTGFNITALLAMLVRTVCIGDRMPSAVKTVFSSLIVVLSVMLGHTALTRMPEFRGDPFFRLTMVSIIVVGTANTMMQDGLLRLVATFPPRHTQAVVSGQSMAGVLVSISSFVILMANAEARASTFASTTSAFETAATSLTPSSPSMGVLGHLAADADLNAFVYFVFAFLVVILAAMTFVVLTRMHMFRFYHHERPSAADKAYLEPAHASAVDDVSSRERLLADVDDNEEDVELDEDDAKEFELVDLAYKIRYYAGSIFLVFLITMAIFPAVVSLLHSVDPSRGRLFRELFVPAFFILVNISDFMGRYAAASWAAPNARQLFFLSLARVLLIPLAMLCNLQNEHHQVITVVLFKNDLIPFLLVVVLSFTNGLFCTQALMHYPRVLSGSKEKAMGGTVMFFLLSIGLSTGSLLAFVLLAMLKP